VRLRKETVVISCHSATCSSSNALPWDAGPIRISRHFLGGFLVMQCSRNRSRKSTVRMWEDFVFVYTSDPWGTPSPKTCFLLTPFRKCLRETCTVYGLLCCTRGRDDKRKEMRRKSKAIKTLVAVTLPDLRDRWPK
jgi:hypothetical protein